MSVCKTEAFPFGEGTIIGQGERNRTSDASVRAKQVTTTTHPVDSILHPAMLVTSAPSHARSILMRLAWIAKVNSLRVVQALLVTSSCP